MDIAKVAILGRPNVGKSTLFNILTRSRRAVVKDQPGVTRDILMHPTEWWGSNFEVIDTGGLTDQRDVFSPLIKKQVLSILGDVDLIVVVTDGRSGLAPEDRDAVRVAQQSGKPFLVVVNKVDRMQDADMVASEFHEFGCDVIAASFEQRAGVDEVVTWIIDRIPEAQIEERQGVRLAVVGKPNVGKSSLFNRLMGHERVLVSPVAGTTVDSVEDGFNYNEREYIIVDTAGLRRQAKRNKLDDGVEILSAFKSQKSINKAEIVMLLVDAVEGPTEQDAKLVEYIIEHHKAVILVANKIDLAEKTRPAAREWFRAKIEKQFHFFPDIPVLFISAHTGAGLDKLFVLIEKTFEKLHLRIKTSKLNDFFYQVIRQAPAPVWGSKNVKFYYLTQTKQKPPSFIAFANHPEGVTPGYRRFLTKRIQEAWDLQGIPVRMFIMKKGGGGARP